MYERMSIVFVLLIFADTAVIFGLVGALYECHRQIAALGLRHDPVSCDRDRWKKRATDAEGAAGSLRYALNQCKAELHQAQVQLAEPGREVELR